MLSVPYIGLIAWYIVTVKKGVAGLSVQNDTLTSVVATIIESGTSTQTLNSEST